MIIVCLLFCSAEVVVIFGTAILNVYFSHTITPMALPVLHQPLSIVKIAKPSRNSDFVHCLKILPFPHGIEKGLIAIIVIYDDPLMIVWRFKEPSVSELRVGAT